MVWKLKFSQAQEKLMVAAELGIPVPNGACVASNWDAKFSSDYILSHDILK
jgi:hypothetical protein